MNEEWDLTEEHYQIAEKNGISRFNVKQRVETYGYDIQKAITKPVRIKEGELWKKWKHVCKEHSVSNDAFRERINLGWKEEVAATEPIKPGPERQKEKAQELRNSFSPYWEQAEANGISFKLFRKRLAKGMSLEEAANRPKRWRGGWKA